MKYFLFCAGLWLALVASAQAQTSLLTEDFESGTLGGFTAVNGPQTPAWYAGAAPGNGPRWSGNTAAFVSSNAGTYGPLSGLNGVVHLYRDVTFPAGTTEFVLRFDFRSQGVLDVHLAPTSYQPTAGVRPTSPAATQLSANLQNGGYYSTAFLRLPATVAGTTQRLIFTWASSSQVPAALPAVLDNVEVTAGPPVALAGAYTLSRQQPRSPRNFQSLTDVFFQLNTAGTSAPVTVAIPAGQRFTELVPQLWGTNTHPVAFQKQGVGPNPQLQGGNIDLVGAHHVTFDGLDIAPGPEAVGPEAGYAISGAFDQGSHDIHIRNATITMRQTQAHTKGVYQRNLLLASAGPGDTALVNRRIHYENLQIQQSCHGIWVAAGIGNVPDYDVEVARVTIGDGTPGNIGYPTNGYEAYGMYFMRVNGLNVHDNVVQGVVSRTNFAVGIYVYDLMGPLPSVFANNRIRDIEFRHPANPAMSPVMPALAMGLWLLQAPASQALAAGHPVRVFNNEISELRHRLAPGASVPTDRNGQTYGVLADLGGFATSHLFFAHNTVAVAAPAWANFSSSALLVRTKNASFGTAEILNNILLNTTPPISPVTATTVQAVVNIGIAATQATPPLTRVRMDHNDLVLTTGAQRYLGTYFAGTPGGTQQYASLAAWQAGTGFDTNSVELDPQFGAGAVVLRPTNAALDNAGTPVPSVATDLAGTLRGPLPDMGAYEFSGTLSSAAGEWERERVQAWPVPFADQLHIAVPRATTTALQLELLDGLGRVVRQQAVPDLAESILLTGLQNLPAGPYWLRLRSPQGHQQVRHLMH
ncbi:hypothetical protein KBK19_09635 [Microvirga sp. STR05]|uniref:T9SS type A sorting domain-containing protein n=1 Tax=Hymenobacter duratus TaxID=2771356 RepID=A0ABR8JEL3_9BACT|nr:hypothetical protein [Hymenobacter duratus]MBD2715296.1 hypothetical protein [Hymenobacter duratus]MBR7950203.1 hypothetical protein [Microvirga sp. STR05]